MRRRFIQLIIPLCLAIPALAQTDGLLDVSTEWLGSDDVKVLAGWSSFQYPLRESMTLTGRIEFMDHSIDYLPNAPVDPFGSPVEIDESLAGARLSLVKQSGRHQVEAGLSAYDGFRNYSSIWIDRYYRQQYSPGGLPGVAYEDPDPKGFASILSYRYEAIPAAGYLTFTIGFLNDTVAPGYEIEDLGNAFELVKGDESLDTWTGSIEWEGILNPNARTRHALSVTDTTGRQPRFTWSGGLNYFLGGNLISKTLASYAVEDPGFDAWSVTQSLEFSLGGNWSVEATLRYYKDSGQIETANLVSSAAPELVTHQAYLSLRYTAADQLSGLSLSVGPYETRYGPTGIGTERFKNLYKDRNWIWARLAARISF